MKPGNCPKCNSNDLNYDKTDVDRHDECFYYPFTCNNCSFEGREYYEVSFTGFEDNDGNEITEDDKDYCDKGNGCKHLGENTCANSVPNSCFEEREE